MSETIRAGRLKPVVTKPTYKITTSDAADYIQEKINVMAKIMRKRAAEEGKDIDVPDVTVTMISSPASKKFYPFMILLPMEACNGKGKRDNSELSLFNPDSSSGSARLKGHIFRVLSNFQFSKDDRKALNTSSYRRELGGMSVSTTNILIQHMVPRIDPLGLSKTCHRKMVGLIIDPYRVFEDMLTDPDRPGEKFKVHIEKVVRISDNSCEYTVTKEPEGKHSNGNFASRLGKAAEYAFQNKRVMKYDED